MFGQSYEAFRVGRLSRLHSTLCGVVLSLGLTCSAAGAASGDLRFGVLFDLRDWNPQTQPNLVYIGPVYEGLLQIKSDGQTPEPGLAESWELSQTDITFKLRKGVTFHDGTPFNADAVIANVESIQKAGNGWTDGIAAISKAVKIDDHTVKFELDHPDPALPYTFTQPGLFMISPRLLVDGSWKKAPSGTGPYVYDGVGSVPGSRYVFKVYDKYYAPDTIGPNSIEVNYLPDDATRLNALLSGQVDVIHGGSSQSDLAKSAGFEVYNWMAFRHHLVLLDRGNLLGDARVRKAICTAVPKEQISLATEEGLAQIATQKVSEGDPAFVASLEDYPYDIERAKALMAEAGNPKISFAFPTYAARKELSQLLQESLAKIGVTIELQMMTPGEYFSTNLSTKYPMFYNALTAEWGGMFRYYPFRFAKDGKANVFKVDPPAQLDELYRQALVAPANGQPALLQQMTRIIHDEALDCGFLDMPFSLFYDPKRIKAIATTNWAPSALRYKEMRMAD